MKKLIIAAVLALSLSAQAASPADTQFCATVAENSALVVDLHKRGVTWEQIEGVMAKHLNRAKPRDMLSINIQQEAYYSWNNFEPAQIKQLGFMKCQIGMLSL